MDLGIEGRVALVMGASKGIGRAIAARLCAEGARVAVSARTRPRLEATAEELGALAVPYDSNDLDGVPRLVRAVEAGLGPIDIVVCNTGGPPAGEALGFGPDDWRRAYTSLVLAPMALITAVLPGMQTRGWGRVLNVVSTSVREPIPGLMLSNAHRSSMIAAFKTLARDFAATGVTLNSVLPGLIATDRVTELYGSSEEAAEVYDLPARRLGTADELAAAAAFLCSAPAAYISGETLTVDGAMTRSV